jgi:hypothetical protein
MVLPRGRVGGVRGLAAYLERKLSEGLCLRQGESSVASFRVGCGAGSKGTESCAPDADGEVLVSTMRMVEVLKSRAARQGLDALGRGGMIHGRTVKLWLGTPTCPGHQQVATRRLRIVGEALCRVCTTFGSGRPRFLAFFMIGGLCVVVVGCGGGGGGGSDGGFSFSFCSLGFGL